MFVRHAMPLDGIHILALLFEMRDGDFAFNCCARDSSLEKSSAKSDNFNETCCLKI